MFVYQYILYLMAFMCYKAVACSFHVKRADVKNCQFCFLVCLITVYQLCSVNSVNIWDGFVGGLGRSLKDAIMNNLGLKKTTEILRTWDMQSTYRNRLLITAPRFW
jgi:hypothetical protein